MKQFGIIFKFELVNYLKNKIFIGVTVFLVAVIAAVMFFPGILDLINSKDAEGADQTEYANIADTSDSGDAAGTADDEYADEIMGLLLLSVPEEQMERAQALQNAFQASFPEYEVVLTEEDTEAIKKQVISEKAECAFVLNGMTSYTYYVGNLSMYDINTEIADEILRNMYSMNAMVSSGMSEEEAQAVLSAEIEHEIESLGKDQMQNFFYTYIMIFALYMVILLYGQMVATNVATEKSSRAMELLITSAKPVSMMFGKVVASCLAGFIQILVVFGSSILFYNLNQEHWEGNIIVASIFDMPLNLLVYMLIFFVLGFFVYAFMFGAIGSTASKVEDINTSVMPVTLLFVAGFIVVMMSMSSGNIDSLLMRICSYVPFTSPMAMFTRIAMSTVPFYEILISIVILIASVTGIGIISAKIYRVGVLLYGTKPKFSSILKAIGKA